MRGYTGPPNVSMEMGNQAIVTKANTANIASRTTGSSSVVHVGTQNT